MSFAVEVDVVLMLEPNLGWRLSHGAGSEGCGSYDCERSLLLKLKCVKLTQS